MRLFFAKLAIALLLACNVAAEEPATEMNIIEQFDSAVAAKNWQRALPLIEEIVQRNRDIATSWHNYGVVLDELRRHADAAKAFRNAYALNPDDYGHQFRAFRSLALSNNAQEFTEFARSEAAHMPEILDLLQEGQEFERVVASADFQGLLREHSGE